MPITAGSISVVRRINTGDYSHKEAKAEIHYTIDPNEDPAEAAGAASMQALTQVAKVLATQVTLTAPPEIKLGGAPESVKSEQVVQTEQVTKRHRRTKEKVDFGPVPAVVDELDNLIQTPGLLAELSDKELNSACNETMFRIKNKALIQGVIQRYTDGAVSMIPQADRAKFLTELEAL